MGAKPGDRVGAISHTDHEKKEVHLFGFGIYEGMKPHPRLKMNNPLICLDNGGTVWGCECWWGSIERIERFLKKAESQGFQIVFSDERRK